MKKRTYKGEYNRGYLEAVADIKRAIFRESLLSLIKTILKVKSEFL